MAVPLYVCWSSSTVAPPDPAAVLNVKIDGNTIFTLTPATASAYSAAYTPLQGGMRGALAAHPAFAD